MPAVVDVPLNTCLADLDEALRTLLKRELERHGFEGVEIAFDAPATDWSAKLTNPTVNLFLYDLRENVAAAEATTRDVRVNGADDVRAAADAPRGHLLGHRVDQGGPGRAPPALAGARDPLLARLAARATCSRAASRRASLFRAIETEVGRPKEEKADFWTSIGGRYKASIDYAVKLEVESGLTFTRGPEVRTPDGAARPPGRPARARSRSCSASAASCATPTATPVANAWVALPDLGRFASTERARDGSLFDGMRPGEHRVEARTATGEEASGTANVPGGGVDLELGGGSKKRSPAKRG